MNRLDFYDLDEEMKEAGIFELSDIPQNADSFITYITSLTNSTDTNLKIEMITKAETILKSLLQSILPKINPDLNIIIYYDNDVNDSYKKLVDCLGYLQSQINEKKDELINYLSNKDMNKLTNKMKIDYFASYLEEILNGIIYTPLKESCNKFFSIEEPATNKIEKLGKDKFGMSKIISFEKDSKLFWYLVFTYLFRSSQVIGYFSNILKTPT